MHREHAGVDSDPSALRFDAPVTQTGQVEDTTWRDGKPVREVKLDSRASLLTGASYVSSLNPNLDSLFTENFEWIAEVATSQSGQL